MKSLSPSTKNNLMTCAVVILVVGLILWLTYKPSSSQSQPQPQPQQQQPCPNSRIVVPIGNGQSVALTREEYQKLKEQYRGQMGAREGFYVSQSDYIPNVQTENEYTPMLSLYKPKEQTRVEPTPPPAPVAPLMPSGPSIPVPVPGMPVISGMTGGTGTFEGYGNVFLENYTAPPVDPEVLKYRQELTGMSPFFLNNGQVMNGQMI